MLALLLATLLVGPSLEQPISVESARLRVVVDLEDNELGRELAAEALAVAEAAWDQCAKWMPVEEKLDEPMTLHLFRHYEAYAKADEELTGGKYKENWAFSSHKTRSSYVPIQPPASDVTLSRLGLSFQTKRVIAHEASHLAVYASFNNFASHPKWFGEGLAQLIERDTLGVLGELGEANSWLAAPYTSSTAYEVLNLASQKRLPTVENILLGEHGGLSWERVYDVQANFFGFLAEGKRADKLRKIIESVRRMGGGQEFERDVYQAVVDTLGVREFARLDHDFKDYIEKLKPEWHERYRSLGGKELAQIAFEDKNAIAWRRRRPKSRKYELKGTLEVVDGRQMNLLLDQRGRGFLSIALVAGNSASATLFDYDAMTSEWKPLTLVSIADFPFGAARDFEVNVETEHLTLYFAGEKLIEIDVPGHDFRGSWGLGAQAGSAGVWTLAAIPDEL